ncbi:MAG: DUF3656 domain-containing U32 family peptidase [Chloroflexota bacterium]
MLEATAAKTDRSSRPEILAPAGSWDAFVAAVERGADAVYLGGKEFNARQSAANFDRSELERAVEYAHLRGVRLCVTVNTLLADSELAAAMDYVYWLYERAVDAVIVQDLGLARLIKQTLPAMEVHGSTQMTVHNLEGVRYLERLGLDRVVLARELSLREINRITAEARIGVEMFIHGALCISYSGQCLFSSLVGGRSGNRGRCAQPCRMPYELYGPRGLASAAGKHLLSPRDLCLIDRLPDLVAAGVRAFKIEGRLKRPEYVATVVGAYRRALDRVLAGDSSPLPPDERWRLTQIFNRGFTTGHLDGNPGSDLMSYDRPHNRGIAIGTVVSGGAGRITVRLTGALAAGDGIVIPAAGDEGEGTTITALFRDGERIAAAAAGDVVSFAFRARAKAGDAVWKTADAALLAEAAQAYRSGRMSRKLPLSAKVQALVGQPLKLWLVDPDGHKVQADSRTPLTEAIRQPLTRDTLVDKLGRLGNTPFAVTSWKIELQGDAMLPLSELNDTRRRAVESLTAARLAAYRRPPVERAEFEAALDVLLAVPAAVPSAHTGPTAPVAAAAPLLTVRAGGEAAARAALAAGADRVYYDPAFPPLGGRPVVITAAEAFATAAALTAEYGRPVIVAGPRIRRGAAWTPPAGQGMLVRNLGDLEAALSASAARPLVADFTLNVFNAQALRLLAEQGVDSVTLSVELTMDQLQTLSQAGGPDREAIVHGSLPLMVSEYCPVGAVAGNRSEFSSCGQPCRQGEFRLRDRVGHMLPLASLPGCLCEIYNPMELCLLEDLATLLATGVAAVRVEGQRYSPETVARVVAIYRQHLDRAVAHGRQYRADPEAVAELTALHSGKLTKGHYYRGVL